MNTVPFHINVDLTGVTLEQIEPDLSIMVPHDSVMFAASVVNSEYCTVQGNPCSVFNADQSAVQPDSDSDSGSLEGESQLLEDSEDDLEFTFRFIL